MTWEDDRLRLCKCEDDTNEREAIFPQRVLSRIFVPDILFLDAITAESFVGYENSHGIWLNQFDKGVRVLWKKKLAMAIACDMNTRCRVGHGNFGVVPLRQTGLEKSIINPSSIAHVKI